jgi:hypothetical protein
LQCPPNVPVIACSTFSLALTRRVPGRKIGFLLHPTLQLNNFSHVACARALCRALRPRQAVVLSSKLFQLHSARHAQASLLKDLHTNSNHGKSILQRMGTLAKTCIRRSLCANPILLSLTDQRRYSAAESLSQHVSAASNSHTRTGDYTSTRPSRRRSETSKRYTER